MKTWAWRAYIAAGVAAGALYLLLASDALWAALGVSAAVATVVGVRWHRPATPLAWYLLAAGLLTFALGDALYDLFLRLGNGEVAYPSVADLLYLATYAFLISGLLLILRARTAGRDRASLLDALAVATSAGMLVWLFLIVPYVRAPELTLPQRLTSIGYPVADLLLLTVVARLWVAGGNRPPAYYLLLAGAVGTLAADAAFGYLQLVGDFHRGGPVDIGWIVFYVAWGAAALHPSMVALSTPVPPGSARLTRGRLALLASVCLVAPAVLVLQWLRQEPIDAPVIAGCSMVLFLIALARMRDLASEVAAQVERRRVLDRIVKAAEHERTRIAGDLHDGPCSSSPRWSCRPAGRPTSSTTVTSAAAASSSSGSKAACRSRSPACGARSPRSAPLRWTTVGSRRRSGTSSAPSPGRRSSATTSTPRGSAASPPTPRPSCTGWRRNHSPTWSSTRTPPTSPSRCAPPTVPVQLLVCDDGVGFAPKEPAKVRDEGRFGLIGMQERVTLAGGRLILRSAPGDGTTVEALLPYVPAVE